jgi:chromosome partitioning protein
MEQIAIVNQKGGVAKTTTAINLGGCLAELGKEILLIDVDPQANLSKGTGIYEKENNIKDVFIGNKEIHQVIYPCNFNNKLKGSIDVIPSNIKLSNFNDFLAGKLSKETILKDDFDLSNSSFKKKYDYILIDCSPSLNLLNINALVLANKIIIPIEPGRFALEGMDDLIDTIMDIREKLNPELKIKGILLTRVDGRTNIGKDFKSRLKDIFGDNLFNTIINQNVKIKEAQDKSLPINIYDKNVKGAKQYLRLAKEVINND